jgi:hypothetical protein
MEVVLVVVLSYWSADGTENDRIGAFCCCKCFICERVVVRIY